MNAIFVEADPVMREHIEALVETAGMAARIVSSPLEALAIMDQEPAFLPQWPAEPIAVIVDGSGGIMSGEQLALAVRNRLSHALLLAHASLCDLTAPHVFDDVFVRPYSTHAMLRAVREHVGTVASRKQGAA